MEKIWRLSEKIVARKLQKTKGNSRLLKKEVERIFLLVNMVLWLLIGIAISFLICKVCLSGIGNNLSVVFMITGYYASVMYVFGYIFMCRRA